MPKVFVVDATVPRGGAYMAYHIGRLIHQKSGVDFINVPITNIPGRIFSYDVPMKEMPREQMEKTIADDDILVCNPSAASQHQFGLRLPGKKIMYVQGFQSFAFLDCHFDVYACASSVVQSFLRATYQLDAPVIPPFIDVGNVSPMPAWETRPENSALVFIKSRTPEHLYVYRWVKERLSEHYPSLKLVESEADYRLPQPELLKKLASHRYLLNISIAEGFGLLPLEAIALNTVPFGLDGLAGRDYMRYGENSFCLSYRELSANRIEKMVMDMQRFTLDKWPMERKVVVSQFSRDQFYTHWSTLLKEMI